MLAVVADNFMVTNANDNAREERTWWEEQENKHRVEYHQLSPGGAVLHPRLTVMEGN